MNAPPDGQQKAPRGVTTASGGKTNRRDSTPSKEPMFPAWVKCACNACAACAACARWPKWLGTLWLKGRKRGAP